MKKWYSAEIRKVGNGFTVKGLWETFGGSFSDELVFTDIGDMCACLTEHFSNKEQA